MHNINVGSRGYPSGSKTYSIGTPSRKKCIRKFARKSLPSMAKAMVNTPVLFTSVVSKLVEKMKSEMKNISSLSHDSILRDTTEAVKNVHWDTNFSELMQRVSILMQFLKQLIRVAPMTRILSCFLLLHNY